MNGAVARATAVPSFNRGQLPESVYVYQEVADHIAARITHGELPVHTRLPRREVLAAEYGVSVPTLKLALKMLQGWGLVKTLPSKGTYVERRSRLMDDERQAPR
ncbi:winged helix-turn-helix transcriptional regulator [Streptosporangiaceae bacterium NEAU-GS5]|nr:winged helix-turn-helix transcriptional regulator [Streptosporangiaceae bacterium NEAU-GS5]